VKSFVNSFKKSGGAKLEHTPNRKILAILMKQSGTVSERFDHIFYNERRSGQKHSFK